MYLCGKTPAASMSCHKHVGQGHTSEEINLLLDVHYCLALYAAKYYRGRTMIRRVLAASLRFSNSIVANTADPEPHDSGVCAVAIKHHGI